VRVCMGVVVRVLTDGGGGVWDVPTYFEHRKHLGSSIQTTTKRRETKTQVGKEIKGGGMCG
jgi:hypothetical protein